MPQIGDDVDHNPTCKQGILLGGLSLAHDADSDFAVFLMKGNVGEELGGHFCDKAMRRIACN